LKLILLTTSAIALGMATWIAAPELSDDQTASITSPVADSSETMIIGHADDEASATTDRSTHSVVASSTATDEDAPSVYVNDIAMPYDVWHAMVMPGEVLTVTTEQDMMVRVDGVRSTTTSTFHWTAPDTPGVHDMRITNGDGMERRLTVFVLQPLNGETVLDGYRIGTYPRNTPEGLIRLSQADMDAPISPHFTIGQFICKQQPGHWPKFLLVSANMMLRLEAVLQEMRGDELTTADSFFVMSGYRTPFYNTAIGSARLSRHMYGDAADIYPDVEGGDGVMDDLNADGLTTRADAEFLYDYASRLFTSSDHLPAGGIGAYGANAVHGPFVHIDGRGHFARWGRDGS
jgi:hypothetical protein